jgi:hypothetical protein
VQGGQWPGATLNGGNSLLWLLAVLLRQWMGRPPPPRPTRLALVRGSDDGFRSEVGGRGQRKEFCPWEDKAPRHWAAMRKHPNALTAKCRRSEARRICQRNLFDLARTAFGRHFNLCATEHTSARVTVPPHARLEFRR